MTPDFRECLATLLARELARALANSNTVPQQLDELYRQRLRKARSTDAMEGTPDPQPDGSWVRARHGQRWDFGTSW